jgi:hypothetical protein
MHVGPKERKEEVQLSSRPVCSLADRREVEWRSIGSRLPVDRNDDEKNSEGIEDALMSSIQASWRVGWRYDGPKKEEEKKKKVE